MFKKAQGKPKQDVLAIKADIDAKNLDAVFMATNNLTYTAGEPCAHRAHCADCCYYLAGAILCLVVPVSQ